MDPPADSSMSIDDDCLTNPVVENNLKSSNSCPILNDIKHYKPVDFCSKMPEPLIEWKEEDVLLWVSYISMKPEYSNLDLNPTCFSQKQLNGKVLFNMNQNDFMALHLNKEVAVIFYHELQILKDLEQSMRDNRTRTENLSDPSDDSSVTANCRRKLRPGRPRNATKIKSPAKVGRLWEFLVDLLYNGEYNPKVICWEDFEGGEFRIVKCNEIAQIWGTKRNTKNMCFEKVSRAMRHHYKRKIFTPCPKRLVYQFGPNAKGWKRLYSSKPLKCETKE